MHCDLDLAPGGDVVLAGQLKAADAPSGQKWPAGHMVGAEAPPAQKEPAGQSNDDVTNGQYLPLGQGSQDFFPAHDS